MNLPTFFLSNSLVEDLGKNTHLLPNSPDFKTQPKQER
jgi:hypothetical protein